MNDCNDPDNESDDCPLIPMSLADVQRAIARIASWDTDHIDLEEEEAQIEEREKIRKERAFTVLENLPAGKYSEAEMVDILRKAGVLDEGIRDSMNRTTLKLIRLARQNRN
jgi:hypothetical protein